MIAESPDAPKPRDDLQPRADSQPTRQNPIAPSDARDDSATATRAEPAKLAQNSQSESDGSSQQNLRIDQGTPTVENPQPGNTPKTQTTDPTFVSTADSNPGTLPSLTRPSAA
jgi:hypothetical protein